MTHAEEAGWNGSLGIFMTQLELPSFRFGRLVQALAYQALE